MSHSLDIRESSGRVVSTGGRPVRLRESAPKRSTTDLNRELAESLRGLGLSPREALAAASGRGETGGPAWPAPRREAAPEPKRSDYYRELREALQGLGLSPRGVEAALIGREAGGLDLSPAERGYTADDFAIATDPNDDSTWSYALVNAPGEPASASLVQAAVAALFSTGAPSADAAALSASDLAATRRKLSDAWDEAFASWQYPPAKPKGIA